MSYAKPVRAQDMSAAIKTAAGGGGGSFLFLLCRMLYVSEIDVDTYDMPSQEDGLWRDSPMINY